MRRHHVALAMQVLLSLATASCLRFGYEPHSAGGGVGGSMGGRGPAAGAGGRLAAAGRGAAGVGGGSAGGQGAGGSGSLPTAGDGAIASCDTVGCDDGIDCTIDTCAADGSCQYNASNAACPGGLCLPDCFEGGCGSLPDSVALTCADGAAEQLASAIECQLELTSSTPLQLATCLSCGVTPDAGLELSTAIEDSKRASLRVQRMDMAAHAFALECSLGIPAFASASDDLQFSQLAYSDGFETDGSADFEPNRNGVWVHDSSIDALRQTQTCESIEPYPATTWTGAGSRDWTDAGIQARVRLDDDCACGGSVPRPLAGVILRSQPGTCPTIGTYAGCAIDAVNDELSIRICSEQCTCSRYSDPQIVVPGGISAGVWYTLTLIVRDGSIECQLSGADLSTPVRLTFENDDVVPETGSFGFVTGCANASFDDVRVTSFNAGG